MAIVAIQAQRSYFHNVSGGFTVAARIVGVELVLRGIVFVIMFVEFTGFEREYLRFTKEYEFDTDDAGSDSEAA